MSGSNNGRKTAEMKRYYWLRDSFSTAMACVMDVTPAWLLAHGHKIGGSAVYPKTTLGACGELQLRGLDASAPALDYMIRRKLVSPARIGRNYQWYPEQIDWAAEHFDRQCKWAATTQFCRVSNLEFGQVVKAYHLASARYRVPFFGSFDMQKFVAVIEPASSPGDYARIMFYPCGAPFEFEPDREPASSQEMPA